MSSRKDQEKIEQLMGVVERTNHLKQQVDKMGALKGPGLFGNKNPEAANTNTKLLHEVAETAKKELAEAQKQVSVTEEKKPEEEGLKK